MRFVLTAICGVWAPEGGDGGTGAGGAAGGAPAPAPAATPPASDPPAQSPAADDKPRGLTPDELRAKLATSTRKAAPAPAPKEPPASAPDVVEQLRRDNAALAERLAAIEGDTRKTTYDGALALAKIKPAYYGQARLDLGDALDITTDAGRAKIDAWAAAHPEVLTTFAPQSQQGPQSAWIDQTLKADPKKQSLASMMPRDFLDQAIAGLVKE